MPHATVPSPGLQALILCGPGSSLSTLTSNPKELPKAIIPIANRPMVWYPLDWCYRMGVTDITLITPPESSGALEAALATNPALTSLPSPKPEILAPVDLTQTTGTGELLRLPEVQKCITSDFVILPCDLICELDGTKVLQQWMTLNPLPTSSSAGGDQTNGSQVKGGLSIFYPTYGLEGISTKKDETDFLATTLLRPAPTVTPSTGSLRPNIEQIVLNMPTDTLKDKVEADKGFLRLRQSLLSKHSRVKLRTKHRDAHVYIFPNWVKDFVRVNESFESISEDLLGWWGKSGWQTGLAEKVGLDEVLLGQSDGMEDSTGDVEEDEPDDVDVESLSSTKVSSPASTQQQQSNTSPFASRVRPTISQPKSSQPKRSKSVSVPPLLAYVQPSGTTLQPLIRRVDTTSQLLSISLHLAKQPLEHSLARESKIHPTAKLEQQSRVSQEDSLVDSNVKIGLRSNIKESVIGASCEIGKNVRLTRCLLMEGVVVGDGVQMTGCIIGRRARIEGMKATEPAGAEVADGKGKKGKTKGGDSEEDRTKLTDCEVAPNFVVEAGTEAKGEKFMGFDTDGFVGVEDEDVVDEDAEGEGDGLDD